MATMEPHRVCSNPDIWVCDGFLSDAFLDHVDALFANAESPIEFDYYKDGNSTFRQVLFDEGPQLELAAVLRRISHAGDQAELFPRAVAREVAGRDQTPHVSTVRLCPPASAALHWLHAPGGRANALQPAQALCAGPALACCRHVPCLD